MATSYRQRALNSINKEANDVKSNISSYRQRALNANNKNNQPTQSVTEKKDSLWVESTAPNVLEKKNINIDVKPLNISNFVKDFKNSEAGQRASLTMEADNLQKQIQQKEQEYNRANNYSDWNKKNQAKAQIGQELNTLKEKLNSTKTSLAELNRPNEKLLTAEQVAENNKNAPLSQKIDKAIKYDIPKTAEKVGRTALDLGANVAVGATNAFEGMADAAVGNLGALASGVTSGFGLAPNSLSEKIKKGAEDFVRFNFSGEELLEEKKNEGTGVYEPKILGIKVRDALNTISNMVVSAVGGPATFIASAAGQNIEEALLDNQSLNRAVIYGDAAGVVEGLTEKMFDAVKLLGGGKFDKVLPKKAIAKLIGNAGGEAIEEVIADGINPVLKYFTYEKGTYDMPTLVEYLNTLKESAWNGFVIGLIMKGGQDISTPQIREQYKEEVYTAVDKSNLPENVKQTVKDVMITPAQAQINQDLQNYRNKFNQAPNLTIQRENVTGLPKLNAQNQAQTQNIEQGNVTLPNRAKMAQNANMGQMKRNTTINPQLQLLSTNSSALNGSINQNNDNVNEFGKQIDDLLSGKRNRKDSLVVLSNTPKIIQELGAKDLPITVTSSKLERIMNAEGKQSKQYHDLGIDIVKQLPEALERPLNILKSHDNSYVVVTELADKQDRPIIASVKIDGTGRLNDVEILSNVMTSAYGRNNYDAYMQRNIKEGNLVYDIDEGIIKENLTDGARLQLSRTTNEVSNNSINQNDSSVNTEYAQNNKNDTADTRSAFSMPKNEVQTFASSVAPRPYMDLNRYASSDKDSKVSKVSLTDIQKAINDIVPVKVGKFRQQAYGIYKTQGEIIRLKEMKDIPVALHELTHHLDKKYNLSSSDKAFSELENIAVVGKNATKQTIIKEGVAEFGRYYMTNKEYAKEIAPFYFDAFERALSNDVEMKNKVEKIRQMVSDYLEQSPISRLASNIDYGDETISLWAKTKDTILKSAKNFRKNFVDDLDPLKKIINEISNNADLPTNKNAYELLRLNNGVTGKVRVALEYGVVDENGKKIGKGLKEVLQPVSNRRDEFITYITALRANDLNKRDIETGLSQKDVEETLNEYKDDEVFEQTAKELYQFQNQILEKTLVKSGIITREALENYNKSNPHYVPFYRVMDENFKRSKDSLSKSPKRIKGSTRDIINPLESIIKNVYSYMQISERNDAYNALFDLANKYDGTGKWFDKVPTDMIGTKITANDVKSILEQLNLGEEDVDYNEVFTTMFKPSYNQKGNIVTVMKNGKPTHYEINDKELYDILSPTNTGRKENIFLTLLNGGAKALRVGATHSPEFILRNPLRDTMDAGIYSKNGFIPLVDTISGIFEIVGKSDLYYKWLESGGSGSTYTNAQRKALRNTLDSITTETTKKPLTKEERARATLKTLKDVAKHPLRTYLDIAGNLSNVFEEGTRVGEFKKALESTGDAKKSALESRNITVDFSRGGTQARDLNKYIAFLNANIQGLDKIVTSFRERPVATGMKVVAYLTIPSILIRALQDEEKMEKVPQWEKDTYWVFFIGDTPVKIPKPQGLGQAFATIPERVIDFIKTQDPKAFDGLAERLLSSYAPIDSPTSIIPTGGQPLVENATNYSFFRQQPIVKQSLQNRSPKYQYDDSTSTIAKKIGGAINYSPKKIDNLISGYLGNLGKDVANIAGVPFDIYDSITGKEKDEKEYQSLNSKLRKIPVVKGFIAGDTASKTVDEFYDSKAKANTDYTDAKFKYSDTKMTPKQEKELEYLKSVNSLYNKAYNDMKDIEDQIDDVSKSNRSNEYKKNMLEKLKKQKDKIAEETQKEADKLKAKNTLITQAEQRAKLKK